MGITLVPPSKRHYDVYDGGPLRIRDKATQTEELTTDEISEILKVLMLRPESSESRPATPSTPSPQSRSPTPPRRKPAKRSTPSTRSSISSICSIASHRASFDLLVNDANKAAVMELVNQKIMTAERRKSTSKKRRKSRPSVVSLDGRRRSSFTPQLIRRDSKEFIYKKRNIKDPRGIGTFQTPDGDWVVNIRVPVHEIILALVSRFCDWKVSTMPRKEFVAAAIEMGWPKAAKQFDKYARAGNGPNVMAHIERDNRVTIGLSDWEDGVETNILIQFLGEARTDVERACREFLGKLTPSLRARSTLAGDMRGSAFYDPRSDVVA